jgi:hypothetical protein
MNQSVSQSNMEPAPSSTQMGDLAMPMAVSSATHVGQGTVIEQSRAAAEVQSAIVVAQRFPRNERHALGRIIAACNRLSLAREAFFTFPRGNETITGASIKLAKEMARSWGNIQHEIVELSQDTKRGESEVMAYAWDLETNTRSAIRFIVPHKRFTRKGVKTLTDPRDIYELIANNGSRRLRQCIFAIMPADLVTEAERVCRETLQKGDGKPLDVRITSCVAAFDKVGVTREMLTEKTGHEPEKLSLNDLTDLQIIFQSIKAGEPIDSFFTVESSLAKPKEIDGAPSEKKTTKKTRQTRKKKTETKTTEPEKSDEAEQQATEDSENDSQLAEPQSSVASDEPTNNETDPDELF